MVDRVFIRKSDGSVVDPATAQGQTGIMDAIEGQVDNAPIAEIRGSVEALAETTSNDLITHTAAGGEGLRGVYGSGQRAGFFRYPSTTRCASRGARALGIETGRYSSPVGGHSKMATLSPCVSKTKAKAHRISKECC